MIQVEIYRYNPEMDEAPYLQAFSVENTFRRAMVLDVLEHLKAEEPTLSYRRSCREGVCGSDGMNMNGKNGLACVTRVGDIVGDDDRLILRPLPGMPVIRDLVVDMALFQHQYERVKPYLINHSPIPTKERRQSPDERKKLDGLYECILCGCCTSACPSWWWNPEKYVGPAGLLQSYRFLADSRDLATAERLSELCDRFSVYRCHNIQNCTWVCPKGLNPMKAISNIKRLLLKNSA